MKPLLSFAIAALLVLATTDAVAQKTDSFYSIQTSASPSELRAGESGSVRIKIKMSGGAYISSEAPLKATLSARNLQVGKAKLGRADAEHQVDGPLFTVPVTGEATGPASLEADLVFFVCTEKLCERQTKKVNVSITVK
jgi:hypothetical protein